MFWAKFISWSLMGGTCFAIGWLCIAKTEEVVIATGKLEPKGGYKHTDASAGYCRADRGQGRG